MADELEPVTQQFIADLGDYIEPIEEAADETEGFADVVEQAKESLSGLRDAGAETGEGMADLAAGEDDAIASTEALSESVGSLRDKVYEMYPGIDEATAALLAEASAAQAAGLELDEYGASADAASAQGDGLAATLISLRSILGGADVGDSLTVGVAGLNKFLIETEDDAKAAGTGFTGLRTDASLLDDAMLKSANSTRDFWEAVNALNPELAYSEHIARDAKSALRDLGATENEAAAGANALVKAQRDWDAAGGGGSGGILAGLANFFGGSGEEGFSLTGLLGNVGSLTAGLGIAAAIGSAAVGITGLVAGLGAAAIGIGSFVALAIPGFEKVKGAIGDTRKELAKLTPDERGAVLEIRGLKSEYEAMAKAFEPDVFRVFNRGLGVARDILPGLKAPADVTAGVLSKILGQLDQMLSPKYAEVFSGEHGLQGLMRIQTDNPLQNFDKTIDPYIKTALPAFAHGLEEVGGSLEHLLKTMSAKDVGDDIRDFFGTVSLAIRGVAHAVRQMMLAWDELHRGFVNLRQWVGDARTDFQNLKEFAEVAMTDLTGNLIKNWDAANKATEHYWVEIGHDVENATDVARESAITAGHDIEAAWDDTSRHVTGAVRDLVDETIADWGYFVRSTERDWDDVVTFVRGIPHRIVGALGDLGGLLVNAGDALMHGFLRGIESGFNDVKNFVSGIGGWIASHKGPVEADAQLLQPHGEAIMHGLVTGLRDGMPELKEQLGLTTSVLKGLGGTGSGSGSAQNVHLTVPITLGAGTEGYNNPVFLQMVYKAVQEATLRYGQLNPGSGLTRIVPGVRTA